MSRLVCVCVCDIFPLMLLSFLSPLLFLSLWLLQISSPRKIGTTRATTMALETSRRQLVLHPKSLTAASIGAAAPRRPKKRFAG